MWFFGVVTAPLIAPFVHGLLPARRTGASVCWRWAVYTGLWLPSRVLLRLARGAPSGVGMLALAAANAVGVVLFGTLYAFAGARVLPQVAFAACLLVLFVLMTVVWVRTEAPPSSSSRLIGRIKRGRRRRAT